LNTTHVNIDENKPFDIIIDDTLYNLSLDQPFNNKALLSLINDYEEGEWRLKYFESFIFNSMVETALSAEEKEALIDDSYSRLEESAKNLRLLDNEETSGEIGEILLYGVMKKYYNALPIVPKIFYKQNKNDYAKGADSVHIVLDASNEYTLWFGEAKFYNSLETSRLAKIIDSIQKMLEVDKIKKELSIVTNIKDLEVYIDDSELVKRIKQDFSNSTSIDRLKNKIHIPIMLLHECAITKIKINSSTEYEEYKNKIREEHLDIAQRFIKKQNKKLEDLYGYEDIKFHLIIFPVPNKSEIVERFTRKMKVMRD
jgi:hypothetical protein